MASKIVEELTNYSVYHKIAFYYLSISKVVSEIFAI